MSELTFDFKVPFIRRKAVAGKSVTFPAESTVSERLYEKNVDLFANLLPDPTAFAHALIV